MLSPSRVAALRFAKRRSGFRVRPNLWPFVGILLALLATFMVSTPPHHGLAVDLPTSAFAAPQRYALREDAIRLSVTKDGTIYFRGSRVQPEEVGVAIRRAVANGAERKVYLQVDSRALYGRAEMVLDQIREAGIRDIAVLAEQPYRPTR